MKYFYFNCCSCMGRIWNYWRAYEVELYSDSYNNWKDDDIQIRGFATEYAFRQLVFLLASKMEFAVSVSHSNVINLLFYEIGWQVDDEWCHLAQSAAAERQCRLRLLTDLAVGAVHLRTSTLWSTPVMLRYHINTANSLKLKKFKNFGLYIENLMFDQMSLRDIWLLVVWCQGFVYEFYENRVKVYNCL